MKKVTYLLAIILGIALFGVSCEKDNDSNEARLRIKSIEQRFGTEGNVQHYEYNTDGLLISVYKNHNIYGGYRIEYNSDKQPIKVHKITGVQGELPDETDTIIWTENGFTIAVLPTMTQWGIHSADSKTIYTLNSSNQLLTQTWLLLNPSTSAFDTRVISTYSWINSDSAVFTVDDRQDEFNPEVYKEYFTLGKGLSPFKGINIAAIVAANINYEWQEIQNTYCTENWVGNYHAAATYEFNDQNYPISAVVKCKVVEHSSYDYTDYIFEYETY